MRLMTLTKDQLSDLYNDRMRKDFPPSELKPLFVMLDAVDKGIYETLGLYDGEEIVGYSCLVKLGNDYLVDYLADCGYNVSKLIEPSVELTVKKGGISGSQEITLPTEDVDVRELGNVETEKQKEINKEARIKTKPYLAAHGYDVSQWIPETSLSDLVGVIKDPDGNPINVVIRSAKQRYIYLSASSFEILMSNPNNLLIVENNQGIRPVTFEELFGNDSNVNLVFDARHTPREYFQALAVIFKYVKNTKFVVRDPHYSAYEEIKGFGLEKKNDGTIQIATNEDI